MSEVIIEELREAGSDCGELMGYYCRGHVPRYEFAQAANHGSGADPTYDNRWVDHEKASHRWWRCVPIAGDPGMTMFHPAKPGERGAFAVTVCESVADRSLLASQRFVDESRRSREAGFCEGLNWALNQLDRIDSEAGKALLETWRENPNEQH